MSNGTQQDTLPDPTTDATDRFEAAPDPDGTLIPIPKEAPAGQPIRIGPGRREEKLLSLSQ